MITYYITATNSKAAEKFAAYLHEKGFRPKFRLDALDELAARASRQRAICGLSYHPFVCLVESSSAGVSVLPFKLIIGEKP
jgi:hypothetical protein